jgi:hypothetical protein
MPPKPIEPAGTADPPPVAMAAPPPDALPPPYGVPPPLGAVAQANALRGARTAKTRVNAPAAATLRPALITGNTVPEFNAETTEIWSC